MPRSRDTLAQAPFDDRHADLILRSSDEVPVHFYVTKSILSVASVVFADMFSISLPASQQPHEVQVVDLTEDSETLDICLRHIYPVQSPNVEDLRQMRILAEFARKYQAKVLEQDVIRYLTDAIKRDPVGVYITAVQYGYKALGVEAVHSSLNLPVSQLHSPNVQDPPAELYVELLRYHGACGEAASEVAFQRSWFPSHSKPTGIMSTNPHYFCSECRVPDFIYGRHGSLRVWSSTPNSYPIYGWTSSNSSEKLRVGPRCLWNYLQRSAIILSHRPTADAVTIQDFVLGEFNCAECSSRTLLYMLGFCEIFGGKVKRAVEQVPLPESLRSLS
ncbi:hypothetical protein BC827DRAFT_1173693 [Russula dissimulans]|nr:hypothetical protein BC827DRAFT_1173693 [Russula dissimulans]